MQWKSSPSNMWWRSRILEAFAGWLISYLWVRLSVLGWIQSTLTSNLITTSQKWHRVIYCEWQPSFCCWHPRVWTRDEAPTGLRSPPGSHPSWSQIHPEQSLHLPQTHCCFFNRFSPTCHIIHFALSRPTDLHRLLTHAGAPSRPRSSEEKHRRNSFSQEPMQVQSASLETVTIKSAPKWQKWQEQMENI